MAEQDWLSRDFYATLGVSKDADDKEIRKAYRKLARKWHPDQNAGDAKAEAKFKEIGEAYSVLNDKEQRERYDAIRAMASGGARFSSGSPGSGGFEDLFGGVRGGGPRVQYQSSGFGGGGGFEDMLSSLFGGGGFAGAGPAAQSVRPQRGSDLNTSTTLSFKQAFEGETLQFTLEGRTMKVRIPPGVRDGQKIKLAGRGRPGVDGGPSGDLVVQVSVTPDPVFSIEKNQLRIKCPVTYPEAVLGATIAVPLPDGSTVSVRVPEGSSSGTRLRVRGKGIKKSGKQGDAIVELIIVAPLKATDEQRKEAEALQELLGEWNPRTTLREGK